MGKNYIIRIPKWNQFKYEKIHIKTWSYKKRIANQLSAVYFLFHDDKIIYIGQSVQLYTRLFRHFNHIIFTHYSKGNKIGKHHQHYRLG